jgi:tRNA (mo5U34)-methyltransferase
MRLREPVEHGELQAAVRALAPWFHNLHLPGGVQTAPGHPLGDFPAFKWREIASVIPQDLRGWRALDVGCNAGFYSFELAKRGAQVVGVDREPHYLNQARWAAEQLGLDGKVEFRECQVYDLGRSEERFDLVLFMGVFYHLRHPLLALDLLAAKVQRLMVFQTLTAPEDAVREAPADMPLLERGALVEPGWPRMSFIEHKVAGDETNWWAPNHAAVLAMLRTSGLRVTALPGHEIYLCEPAREGDPAHVRALREELAAALGIGRR